ncbi:MAG: 23S rRNA (uracil(1939)-C(5))-methyltransferase RlmD [Calditerricola sp.]|nr:23S rRNA (uracil(1939)-C(5))-methyltransferase RlmD [Calditerricola sp.]
MKPACPPVEPGDLVELDISGIAHDGNGVGRYEGFTLFVSGALPGERVRARVVEVAKTFGRAEVAKVLMTSSLRTVPPCSVVGACGGCTLQHAAYEGQLSLKRRIVADAFARIARLPDVPVRSVIGMTDPWRYRNKVQVPVGAEDGRLVAGFFAKGTHTVVDLKGCLLQPEPMEAAVRAVKEAAAALGIPPYDHVRHEGVLRHVVVRVGFRTGEVMVILVAATPAVPRLDELVAAIRARVPGVCSIVLNVNRVKSSVVLGDEMRLLWGREVIHDELGGLRFAISPRSFYQVNSLQTEVLYEQVRRYAALTGTETVIDAYCGVGTIALVLARHAKEVYGVEVVPEAVRDARRNAALNGIANVHFAVGRAEDILPRWRREGIHPDVVVVDPPRKGCARSLLDTLVQVRPERIVYVSCNPATLARDCRILADGGFRVVEVQPVDLFPHTAHVECVALLKNTRAS